MFPRARDFQERHESLNIEYSFCRYDRYVTVMAVTPTVTAGTIPKTKKHCFLTLSMHKNTLTTLRIRPVLTTLSETKNSS